MLHTLAFLPNVGPTQLLIILVVVLLIFGPKNIPKLARMMGRGLREFKDASSKMTDSILDDDDDEEEKPRRRGEESRRGRELPDAPPPEAESKDGARSEREHEKVS